MWFPKVASLLLISPKPQQISHHTSPAFASSRNLQTKMWGVPTGTVIEEQKTMDLSSILSAKAPKKEEVGDVMTAELVVPVHCKVGECILFDDRRNAVTWTSMQDSKLHELKLNYEQPSETTFNTYSLPRRLCSYGMLENNPEGTTLPLVCAWDNGFQVYDVAEGKEITKYSSGEDVNPAGDPTRMNDGRISRLDGRFVAGGFFGEKEEIKMKTFVCEATSDKQLTHKPIKDGMQVVNALCFSLDGKTMYMTDSPSKAIHSYTYNPEDASISNQSLLQQLPEEEPGIPDGAVVDSEGYVWNALCRLGEAKGKVQRIDPKTGKVVFTVLLPDNTSQTSCCCFAGPDLDILFITTNAENDVLKDEPNAGGVYAVKLPFKGLPESRFKF
jgi:L-arabinonolactonase